MNALKDMQDKAIVRIVDDDSDLSSALKFFIELDGWHTAVYNDARSFLAADLPSLPGCLVLDVRMPGLSGLECQTLLAEHGIDLPIIFITGHGDVDMAVQAMLGGAIDFLQKPVDENRLLADIRKGVRLSCERLFGTVSDEQAADRFSALTEREQEIVRLVAQGLSTRAIAERLGIAMKTAEAHRSSGLKKLGTHDPKTISQLLSQLKGAS